MDIRMPKIDGVEADPPTSRSGHADRHHSIRRSVERLDQAQRLGTVATTSIENQRSLVGRPHLETQDGQSPLAGQWAVVSLPEDVPIRHYEVLQALHDLGPSSQHQLSALLCVNRTIMVKLIDAIEREGLVQRHRNPKDRRSYALRLTPEGETARIELSSAVDRAEAGLTAGLTAAEHARLRALLREIATGDQDQLELPRTLATRISYLLTPAHYRVRDRVNDRFKALGLTTALYGTLATIASSGPTSQQAIAEQLGLTGPAIVQTVDRLQQARLVERDRDPADRRSYALKPTLRGQDTLRQAREALAEISTDLDHSLGAKQARDELNRLLRKLLSHA